MKRIVLTSIILTLFLIIAPSFIFSNIKRDVNIESTPKLIEEEEEEDTVEAFFSSSDCFKKTFYIICDKIDIYEDPREDSKVIKVLNKDSVVVAYNSYKNFLYIEDNLGKFGWVKNSEYNLSSNIEKETPYNIVVAIKKQLINIYKGEELLKTFKCSTGLIGNQDMETPLGVFFTQERGDSFYSNYYEQGGKYYIKFFSNYLFHSVPVDKNGTIIEEEEKKIGKPASHGCIRLSMEDIKWMYKNIPAGTKVNINY